MQNPIICVSVECAVNLAADLRRHHEQPQRDQVDVFEAPDLALQLDHRFQILALGEWPDFNFRCALAFCHSASISASVAPGNVAWLST